MKLSGMTFRCAGGESFDLIALALYGDERYASDLLCANPNLADRLVFAGGEVLNLPMVELKNSADQPYPVAKAPWKE